MHRRLWLIACCLFTFPLFAQPLLPDPTLTPGDIDEATSAPDPATGLPLVCRPNFTEGRHPVTGRKVRNVTRSIAKEVFRLYGIDYADHLRFELDHLISLEIGGSNSIKNLWPQARFTQPVNAGRKDRLENHLHKLVCAHGKPLAEAQHEIATNWIASYVKYFGDDFQDGANDSDSDGEELGDH